MGYFHPCMMADPHGNHNNSNAVLIDRALYRANARLLDLQNEIIGIVRATAKACRQSSEMAVL